MQRIVLVSCGCFNPPTIMHLRMFELARDYLHKLGGLTVIGGIISPVNDGYGKKGLVAGSHRLEMAKLSAASNPWIKVSSWEVESPAWVRTRAVLDFYQTQMNEYLAGNILERPDWIPDSLSRDAADPPVRCKLLCGADGLESFNIPKLWGEEDMRTIARDYGIVVITREGNVPHKSIHANEILSQFPGNITIVHEWVMNDISSTKMRQALRRGDSVRYFVLDPVIDYIRTHKLYTSN